MTSRDAHHFLDAQAANPFDSAPMLILADWREEQGDLAGATVLRALAATGTPSLAALSADAANVPVAFRLDHLGEEELNSKDGGQGSGGGDRFDAGEDGAEHGVGVGVGDQLDIYSRHLIPAIARKCGFGDGKSDRHWPHGNAGKARPPLRGDDDDGP